MKSTRADPEREEALRRLMDARLGHVDRDDAGAGRRSLARDLVSGVHRHLTTLDAVLAAFVDQRWDKIAPQLQQILRLGCFQLLFHHQTPAPLVVASTVELAGPRKKERGFINAILRKIATTLHREPATPELARACDVIPLEPGFVARFDRQVLPDPETDLAQHLAVRYGQTTFFVKALLAEHGKDIDALLASLNRPLPLAVRPNTSRLPHAAAAAALTEAGAEVLREVGPVFEVRISVPVAEFAPIADGRVAVHDVVSGSVAPFTGIAAGERVIDLCAGVGGKALHLAELAHGAATVVAADVSAERLTRLKENAARLGMKGVEVIALKKDGSGVPKGPYDRVLVDAPCSNSGVLMKRVEARHRFDAKNMEKLAVVQRELLDRAAALVKPGGILVYATCSVLDAENGARIRAFVAAHPEFTLSEELLQLPHLTTRDGGYMARLLRAS